MTLLAIDMGNTNIVCAVFKDDKPMRTVRMETNLNFWSKFEPLKNESPDAVVISSVVPRMDAVFREACINLFHVEPRFITTENAQVPVDVDQPREIGADRLCNVAAATEKYPLPAIIVDFGTATTYDVVDEKGTFIGGAIAPGIDVSARYLFESAALLRETAFQFPDSPVAKNTVTNLQAGIMFSAVDEVEGMITRINKTMGWKSPSVILTGGFSTLIAPGLSIPHTIDKDLTLNGIQVISGRIAEQE